MKNFIFALLLIGGIFVALIFIKENIWLQVASFFWLFLYGLFFFNVRKEELLDADGHIRPLGFVGNVVICRAVSRGCAVRAARAACRVRVGERAGWTGEWRLGERR